MWEDESPDALAWSVHALAHESVHITGWLNEAMAECLGMQAIGRAAVALGRTPREGRYLAERYWTHWYPWSKRAYRSVECRDGARSICALKATSGRERPARLADFVHSPRVDKRMSLGFSRVGFAVSASDARSRPRAND